VSLFIEYLRAYRGYSILTVTSYGTDLRQFREFLKQRLGRVPCPGEIERETIVQFAAGLAGKAAWTVRRKIACLSSFYAYLMDMGHVHHNPAHRVPLPKVAQKVPVALDEDEARALAQAAPTPWLRCAITLLLSTGLRRSELVGITMPDLDLPARPGDNAQLIVHGKGAKQRVVPLNEAGAVKSAATAFSGDRRSRGRVILALPAPARRPTMEYSTRRPAGSFRPGGNDASGG
jgi:integrase/recombinase XerC